MSSHQLDALALAGAIATIASYTGKSMRQVGHEVGISPSTLTRLAQGKKPSADALVSLLMWLHVTDLSVFITESPLHAARRLNEAVDQLRRDEERLEAA